MNTGIKYYSQTIPEKKGSYSAKFNTTAQVGSTFKRIGVDQCTCVMGTYSLYRLVSIASSELSFFANWTVQWYGKFHCGRVLFTLNNNIIVITFNIISLATIPNQISNTWHPYTTFLNRPVKKKFFLKVKRMDQIFSSLQYYTSVIVIQWFLPLHINSMWATNTLIWKLLIISYIP